jgi:hypothetical protein
MSMTVPLKGKALVVHFFDFFKSSTKPERDVEYTVRCKCGWNGKYMSNKGYTNLQSHIVASHPDYINLGHDLERNQRLLMESFYPKKVRTYWGWLDWVIGDLLPFRFVEKERARIHSNLDNISLDSFMNVLKSLVEVVETQIRNILPDKFALVFDGWTLSNTHFLAVFSTFPDSKSITGYKKVLLSFSPLTNEQSLNADSHIAFFEFILDLYGKWWNNVVALIGDNCSTNHSFAGKCKTYFIGCASHRFNLAMKSHLEKHEEMLKQVNGIMISLKGLIPSAKLRSHTDLKPHCRNQTRWSSTYQMLNRYTQIRDFLPLLEIDELDEKLLNNRQNRDVDSLIEELNDLNSVTLELQRDDITISEVRGIFDYVLEKYPMLYDKLSPCADIILDKHFETGIVKIQQGKVELLDTIEKRHVIHLKKPEIEKPAEVEVTLSLAQQALKKQKLEETRESSYIDLRFLIPTSNICERLFSKAGFCLHSRRLGILPINAECQMFLHMNMDLWNIETVKDILK